MKVKIELESTHDGKIFKEVVEGDTTLESKLGMGTYEQYATRLLKKALERLGKNIYENIANPLMNTTPQPPL